MKMEANEFHGAHQNIRSSSSQCTLCPKVCDPLLPFNKFLYVQRAERPHVPIVDIQIFSNCSHFMFHVAAKKEENGTTRKKEKNQLFIVALSEKTITVGYRCQFVRKKHGMSRQRQGIFLSLCRRAHSWGIAHCFSRVSNSWRLRARRPQSGGERQNVKSCQNVWCKFYILHFSIRIKVLIFGTVRQLHVTLTKVHDKGPRKWQLLPPFPPHSCTD